MNEEKKPIDQQGPPQFISKLKGKKVVLRLLSGGQPVTGTLEAYSPYEILIRREAEDYCTSHYQRWPGQRDPGWVRREMK
jgi:small nuclear ribonucleoprotein (snRNP)-like protein